MKKETMILYNVELKCCKRPWGLFNSSHEAVEQVQSLIRCHEAYYKYKKAESNLGFKTKAHKTVVAIVCKPAVTWSDIYAGRA